MERRDFIATGIALPSALRTMVRAPEPMVRASGADEAFEDLVEIVQERMLEHGIPGAAFGVIKDGEIQTRALGVTNVEDPRPATTDTIFELASLSKTVTATAAMTLVQQGELDLDAPVRRYVPTFRVQDEVVSASVTLRDLLTHSPGWEARYSVEEGEVSPRPLGRDHRGPDPARAVRESLELQQFGLRPHRAAGRDRYGDGLPRRVGGVGLRALGARSRVRPHRGDHYLASRCRPSAGP